MKNNYRFPRSLGNKYFFIYSFMTLFLFFIIIILQFSITRFLILKNESDILITKIADKQKSLMDFIDYQKYVASNTASLLQNTIPDTGNFMTEKDSTGNIQFYYYTEEQIKSKKIEWTWLAQTIEFMNYQQLTGINHIIAIDKPLIYSVTLQRIQKYYSDHLLVTVSLLGKEQLGHYENLIFIDQGNTQSRDLPAWIREYYLQKKDDLSTNILFKYFKVNYDKYCFFTLLQDSRSQTSVIACNEYNRDINRFFTRTWILMTLLLFASLSILIFTFGKWFSIQMLKPIKNLSEQMLYIAQNPMDMKEYKVDSPNELQIIIAIYNQMVCSLKEYQYSLLQYKTLFDQAHLGFFWLDENLNIKLFNPEFMKIFELTESPINRMITDVTPLRSSLFIHDKEYTFTDLEMWIESLKKFISFSLQRQEINNQAVFIGMISDITQHRRLKESKKSLEMELIRINRLAELGKRIQGIVHNLNSPLNSILGFAQFLKEDIPDNSDIDKIISSARAMSQSIKMLLAKIKKDSMASPDLVDLNQFICLELENYKHHLFFKNEVVLKTDLEDNLPQFLCTYGDLSQVFNVIFNNAIDAMEKSLYKEIQVSSFITDDFVGFEIGDTGSGIAPDNLDKIFEPNFTTKSMSFSGGFGLGLAIAQSVINRMNGKIEVKSEVGKGSRFRVYIPYKKS